MKLTTETIFLFALGRALAGADAYITRVFAICVGQSTSKDEHENEQLSMSNVRGLHSASAKIANVFTCEYWRCV